MMSTWLSLFWLLVGMSIRPSQPQREENPFSGFLLHLAPCLASSRSSILGVWGRQPNKPLWIQKVCQCRQSWASRGLWGRQAVSPRCDTGSILDLWGQVRAWSQDPGLTAFKVTGLAASLSSQQHGRKMSWTSFWFLPVPVHKPDFRVLCNSPYITAGTMSHKVCACKKECLTNEKKVCSEVRAADLCVLCWGLPALSLFLSIKEKTFHGFWREILRKSYSSCFMILCQGPKVPRVVPWTQSDKQASADGAHSPTPGANGQKACRGSSPLCGRPRNTSRFQLYDWYRRDWALRKEKRTKGIHLAL